MEKKEIQRYNNELIVAYAKELIKRNKDKNISKDDKSIDITNLDLLNYAVSQIIFKQNDLENLLESYLFTVGNEKLGQHENIMGDVKRNINGFVPIDSEISEVYYGLKKSLLRRINYVLANSSEEIQYNFFEKLLSQKEKELNGTVLSTENNRVRYEERKDELVESYMNDYGLTHDQALQQFFYLLQYDGRRGLIAESQVQGIGYLIDYLGRNESTTHYKK